MKRECCIVNQVPIMKVLVHISIKNWKANQKRKYRRKAKIIKTISGLAFPVKRYILCPISLLTLDIPINAICCQTHKEQT